MLAIADLTDDSLSVCENLSHLSGTETKSHIGPLTGKDLCIGACGTCQLRALSGIELNRMNGGAYRDVVHRKRIAGLDLY